MDVTRLGWLLILFGMVAFCVVPNWLYILVVFLILFAAAVVVNLTAGGVSKGMSAILFISKQLKRMSRQTFHVLLAIKTGLKNRCALAYRFTQIRFVIRNLRNRFFRSVKDGRLFRVLIAELSRWRLALWK